jgi:hypothetical protein
LDATLHFSLHGRAACPDLGLEDVIDHALQLLNSLIAESLGSSVGRYVLQHACPDSLDGLDQFSSRAASHLAVEEPFEENASSGDDVVTGHVCRGFFAVVVRLQRR